ncbi:unnamed protein product [Rhizoctonia solani]|uniref:Uncharacterized protein n=1 Tax=Rhizoctonia solani TaxID=456999 RepID=A0A8H3HUQ6_9AGAM|nr:unnamed protein product [Rhizoctonia solani]
MSTATPTRKPLPGYYQFGAGAFAGVTEICIFYPLDVVKTRMQLDTGKSPSMLTSFKNIIREEGAGRLYRGLVPPLLLEAPKRAVKFASNDYWGKTFLKYSPDGKMTQGLSILTGAAAGATESVVVVPFELVKIRLQDKTSKYAGPMDVVRSILRQHGPLGLYAGMESTFWRHVWWIAACGLTLQGPPNELAMLTPVCRSVNAALCAQFNPGLHARIFAVKFDVQAPIRRFADAGRPLTARCFAQELQRRFVLLKRIRRVSNAGRLIVCSEDEEREDLWMLYLMLTESEGHNWEQALWAHATGYIRIAVAEHIMPLSRPGYMTETTIRSLCLWLMWFLTEVYFIVAEAQPETGQAHAVLRPWALASHRYDIVYAPYTHWKLPAPNEPDLGEDPFVGTLQYLADLDLRDRTEMVTVMGRRIPLTPPRASIAAIMAFMVRLERNGPIPAQPRPPIPNPPGQFPSTVRPGHPGLTIYPRTRYPAFYGPGSIEFDGRINRLGSAVYDTEWRRLLQCGNPYANPRFKLMPMFRPGELAGHWEGRFVFLTFDAFRDMLTGVIGAVTNGPIAQQPHVWRIREHHLVERRRRFPLGRASDLITGEQLPIGAPLDAYIPSGTEFIHHGEPSEFGTRRLEVRLLDPTSPIGYKSYNYTTIDGPVDLPPTYIQTNEVVAIAPPRTDIDQLLDWGQTAPPTLGDGDDEYEEKILDTLITGEGHSSWGSFKLRGRIRAWDGMIILVKDYDGPNTQGRGRWLYKGYIVSGGNWVGRWRDTFTSERLSGYEGVFSVTRRY